MRVVVTRPASEGEGWVSQLRLHGLDALALPLIAIAPPSDVAPIAAAWSRLATQRAAMFVSANAVRGFFGHRARAAWPAGVRAWATGGGTASALLQAGVATQSIDVPGEEAPQFDSEALWQLVAGQVQPGDEVLVVRGGDAATGAPAGRDWLAGQLSQARARVSTVVTYLRGMPHWTQAQFQLARDAAGCTWLFSSSQAVTNLQSLLPGADWSRASALATHPRIAQAARAAGFGVVCESRPAIGDVVTALESLR